MIPMIHGSTLQKRKWKPRGTKCPNPSSTSYQARITGGKHNFSSFLYVNMVFGLVSGLWTKLAI